MSIVYTGERVELCGGHGDCFVTAHNPPAVVLSDNAGGISAMIHMSLEDAKTLARSMLEAATAAQGDEA